MPITIDDSDAPPDSTLPDDTPPNREATGELQCERCGKDLVYGGRGRKPRFCDEHKPNRAKNTSSRTGRSKLGNLQKQLEGNFAAIGSAVYIVDRFDGMVIIQRSPALAESLTSVAEQNPKVRQALESMMTASAWSQVIIVAASIAVPIAAHHKLLPTEVGRMFLGDGPANGPQETDHSGQSTEDVSAPPAAEYPGEASAA